MVQFKQPLTSTSSATDTVAVLCTVEDVDTTNLIAHVIDQVGVRRNVSIKILPGKPISYPATGERWVISREYGDWMFIASVNVPPAVLVPSGVIWQYGGSSAPAGWLLCDGSSLLRASFPDLFTAIGTTYGSADGTHFALPDFTSKFPRGNAPGTSGGADAHTHTSAAHLHTLSDAGQAEVLAGGTSVVSNGVASASWTSTARVIGTNSVSMLPETTGAALTGSTDSATPGPTGSSSNIPAYLGVNFIIKT